jgi:probable HAF family extracellular repeat protein
MADLGTLGGSQSIGLAINATGQVAGWSYTPADAALHAFVYAGGKMVDLNSLGIPGWNFYEAIGINDNLQITGYGDNGFSTQAFVVTLQPDWQGGNGSWSDANHWNFAGLGAMGVTPGAVHDVVINPTGSATVYGTDATVRSLLVAGNTGQIVTLNLNGGAIETSNGTTIDPNGVLAGSGRLGGTLTVNAGGRINVGGGESMQLAGGAVYNAGTVRVLGTAASPASLEVGGALTNSSGGQINAQNANLSFLGGLSNAGQVNVTFGVSNIAGSINNASGGKIIVSNGAQASFFDSVVNNGELRVSAGGAANFFGLVSGAGSFTGTGQSRFEGGFSPGNSPALVTVDTTSTFSSSSPITMELGGTTPGSGHDKVVFNGAVSLEGGDLDVLWYGGWTGSAGDVYDLFDWNGGLSGLFGNVNLPTLASGLSWDIANLYTSGEISVLGPVPEPETYAMLLAGLGLLGFAGRRRKNGRISTN